MTYVITESCIRCRYTDCVEVCPVDCFHAGEKMLVINPEECIDCNLCINDCPVDAIYAEDDVPDDQKEFIDINAKMSQIWPVLSTKEDPPSDADYWSKIKSKRHILTEE